MRFDMFARIAIDEKAIIRIVWPDRRISDRGTRAELMSKYKELAAAWVYDIYIAAKTSEYDIIIWLTKTAESIIFN